MEKTSVLYFSAPWCAPCKAFLPEVEAVCKEQGASLTVYDVHLDSDATERHNVKSVPTLIIFAGDDMHFRSSNVIPRQQLAEKLQDIGGR